MFASVRTLAVAALSLAAIGAAQSANKIGWTGTLQKTDAGLAGTVKVVDANTLMIQNYKLAEASAPALYWWGAVDSNLGGGFRISSEQVTKAATSDTLIIKLDAGKTTADFSTVGLWCERFSANFGQATLQAADGMSATTPSSASGSTPTPIQSAKPGAGSANRASFGAVGALAVAAAVAAMMA